MSVYTSVSEAQLGKFLEKFDLGRPVAFTGITAGIVNSNYFLDTDRGGRYVLTLFEALEFEEVPFFLNLTSFLAEQGLPCAAPLADRDGMQLHELNGRPAALVMRLEGTSEERPGPAQCREVGCFMGRMHVVAASFPARRGAEYSMAWCRRQAAALQPLLSRAEQELLQVELDYEQQRGYVELPCGIIHSDLFRDNALFKGKQLTGILDFYCACHWPYMYDLAVAVNDWCHGDPHKTGAMLQGYRQAREVTAVEMDCWPAMLRAAALRFWLSRLVSLHFPKTGELTHVKDPEFFRELLCAHVAQGERLREPWFEARESLAQ